MKSIFLPDRRINPIELLSARVLPFQQVLKKYVFKDGKIYSRGEVLITDRHSSTIISVNFKPSVPSHSGLNDMATKFVSNTSRSSGKMPDSMSVVQASARGGSQSDTVPAVGLSQVQMESRTEAVVEPVGSSRSKKSPEEHLPQIQPLSPYRQHQQHQHQYSTDSCVHPKIPETCNVQTKVPVLPSNPTEKSMHLAQVINQTPNVSDNKIDEAAKLASISLSATASASEAYFASNTSKPAATNTQYSAATAHSNEGSTFSNLSFSAAPVPPAAATPTPHPSSRVISSSEAAGVVSSTISPASIPSSKNYSRQKAVSSEAADIYVEKASTAKITHYEPNAKAPISSPSSPIGSKPSKESLDRRPYIEDIDLLDEVITIRNPVADPLDISGWIISDQQAKHTFVLPNGSIVASNSRLHIYCSAKGRNLDSPNLKVPRIFWRNKDGSLRMKNVLNDGDAFSLSTTYYII
jgi:hypothetical protein